MRVIYLAPKDAFGGFVSLFSKRTKNVYEFINATGKRVNEQWGDASTIINYSITSNDLLYQYASPNAADDAYVEFDFSCPICLTHYTLRTRTSSPAERFPVSWKVFYLSNNDVLTNLDEKNDRTELKGTGKYFTYGVDNICTYTRKIKIQMTKNDPESSYFFHLSRVEFFGEMDVSKCHIPFRIGYETCNKAYHSRFSFIDMLLIISLSI